MDPIVIYIILGIVGAAIHQLSTPITKNNIQTFIKAILTGAVAPIIMAQFGAINYAAAIAYGMSGDYIISLLMSKYNINKTGNDENEN